MLRRGRHGNDDGTLRVGTCNMENRLLDGLHHRLHQSSVPCDVWHHRQLGRFCGVCVCALRCVCVCGALLLCQREPSALLLRVLAQVTNMYSAFRGSYNPAITTWDVSSVTDMDLMFYTNTAFNRGARPA